MTIVYIVLGWVGLSVLAGLLIGKFIEAGKGGPDGLG